MPKGIRYEVELIDATPEGVPRIAIGNDARADAAPHAVVLVRRDGVPALAVELYPDEEREHLFHREAIEWRGWIAIGFGHTVVLVAPETHAAATHSTEFCTLSYFDEFHPFDNFLLVATGCGLMRFDPDGRLAWQTGGLGIDGVTVGTYVDGRITGDGEWDPPGGWRAFEVDAETGAILVGPAPPGWA